MGVTDEDWECSTRCQTAIPSLLEGIGQVAKRRGLSLEELELIGKVSHYCPLSGHLDWNLDGLLEHIWEYCDMIRVYTKPKGQDPDWNEPIVLPRRKCTVEDFCNKIHKLMMNNFKHALVYGQSAKHRPQRVGKDHVLKDEDIVQVVKFI